MVSSVRMTPLTSLRETSAWMSLRLAYTVPKGLRRRQVTPWSSILLWYMSYIPPQSGASVHITISGLNVGSTWLEIWALELPTGGYASLLRRRRPQGNAVLHIFHIHGVIPSRADDHPGPFRKLRWRRLNAQVLCLLPHTCLAYQLRVWQRISLSFDLQISCKSLSIALLEIRTQYFSIL